jgi:hypothetical protein
MTVERPPESEIDWTIYKLHRVLNIAVLSIISFRTIFKIIYEHSYWTFYVNQSIIISLLIKSLGFLVMIFFLVPASIFFVLIYTIGEGSFEKMTLFLNPLKTLFPF